MDKALVSAALSGSKEARDALIEQGASVVAAVLEVLCDASSPVDWTVPADVLCKIGEPALLPLAEAVASAASPEAARRAGWALGRLKVADQAAYVPLLRHPHAAVRSNALYAFQSRGEAAAGFVDRLVPALGDPESEVRQRAVWAFKGIGTGAVPALRRLRQEPSTAPRIRSGALEALAEIGGPGALSGRDLAVWRRLTRIKLLSETPEDVHLCGYWYAVRSDDQAAVLEAFGLGDPEPVTLRTGTSAWNSDTHSWDGKNPHQRCARVYVSPVLDGWTLVFGDSSEDSHLIEEADDQEEALPVVVRRRCAELSRRFGAAHWFGMSCGDDWTAWCLAEGGEVVRHYDAFDAAEKGYEGPGHPAEAGYLLPHEDGFPEGAFAGVSPTDHEAFAARYQQVKEELAIPDTCCATHVAARVSVDPGALGTQGALGTRTRVTGTGVLALTACGRRHGHPAGALTV
ncbi:HEAT repeat domain-containing protein [Streptomyces sp. S.PB5]|uniref:HEAT repeat domain-containing protein n=1 Tax=Streptomyces sp. S.PB5 TaxID=3020844 RepID=UPI0025AEE39B|nr:HEAT repeat domain-containing protein [Streptomyces sp. S.PB5]MDN3025819.1 HEAT repeat domain-containing protein [Streptomyces sp. S.PB5]